MAQSIILRRWETIATVRATVRDCPDLQRHPFRIWLGDRPPGAELLNRPTMWSCRRTGKVVWETRRPFSVTAFVAASRAPRAKRTATALQRRSSTGHNRPIPWLHRRRSCAVRSSRMIPRTPLSSRVRIQFFLPAPAPRIHDRVEAVGEFILVVVGVAFRAQVDVALRRAQRAEVAANVFRVRRALDHR